MEVAAAAGQGQGQAEEKQGDAPSLVILSLTMLDTAMGIMEVLITLKLKLGKYANLELRCFLFILSKSKPNTARINHTN
jgi:hypothetical protein